MELDTQTGPLISGQQRAWMHAFVEEARQEGASVLCDMIPSMRVWREVVFGPVVCAVPFADEANAIRLANDSAFGLGTSIHTGNLKRAHRVAERIQAGVVWINDHHRNSPSSSWGGVTAGSGIGRENGVEAFHEYTQSKSVVVGKGEERFDWFVPGAAAASVRYS